MKQRVRDQRRWHVAVALIAAASLLAPATRAAAAVPPGGPRPCVASDDANAYTGMDTRPARPRLTARFVPARAFICVDDQRLIPGRGRWDVLVGRQLIGRLTELTTALRRPDEQPPVGSYACAAVLIIAPTIVLYSASGKAFRPRIPLDACRQPQYASRLAVAHLHARTVQVLLRHQVETAAQVANDQRAAKLGCAPAFKDLFVDGLPHQLSAGGPLVGFAAIVTVCRYLPDTSRHDSTFVAGHRLTPAQSARLLRALSLPGKPGACTRKHTGVIVLTSRSSWVEAEVGGCSRVVRANGSSGESLGRADAAVVSSLLPT